nr:putative pentatricopeptide repeat-containing protein At3g13770, mitochondrial [Ipomoea batatas]
MALGAAMVLDEIINHVQYLQRQVELGLIVTNLLSYEATVCLFLRSFEKWLLPVVLINENSQLLTQESILTLILSSLLNATSCMATFGIQFERQIHSLVFKTPFTFHMYVESLLLDMYAKAGRGLYEDAINIFCKLHGERMPSNYAT